MEAARSILVVWLDQISITIEIERFVGWRETDFTQFDGIGADTKLNAVIARARHFANAVVQKKAGGASIAMPDFEWVKCLLFCSTAFCFSCFHEFPICSKILEL